MNNLEPIMISALNHFLYCPRRCALVHVEQVWSENLYTMRGKDVHEHVHDESSHEVFGIEYERALPIWSRRLNLTGKADLVEFHEGIPYPVEYKAGRHKEFENDLIQLCAQAACLEEMFGVPVNKGALYWHGSHERREIVFTADIKRQLDETVAAVADILEKCILPPPINNQRCPECSLKNICLPSIVADKGRNRRAARELFEVKP